MAGEVNTEVKDDPDGARRLAGWLGQAQPHVGHIGDAVQSQSSASAGFWEGSAASACRAELGHHRDDAVKTEQQIGKVKDALNEFGRAIDTVRARMEQARSVAAGHGLTMTPTAILPPAPAPAAPLPPEMVAPQDQARHQGMVQAHLAAQAKHQEQQRAFEEAQHTVDDARSAQADAHTALQEALDDPLGTIKSTKAAAVYAAGTGLSFIKGSHGSYQDLVKEANGWDEKSKAAQARAMSTESPAFKGLWERASQRAADRGSTAWTRAAKTDTAIAKISPEAKRIISADPSGVVKGTGVAGKIGKNLLRGLPAVGSIVTVGSGAIDVAMGKDVGEAAEDTGANLAGGAAGGWAGAAIGTAICPGVGTAIGGVVGGVGGSLAATGALDWITGD